jgi:hypothetical protein
MKRIIFLLVCVLLLSPLTQARTLKVKVASMGTVDLAVAQIDHEKISREEWPELYQATEVGKRAWSVNAKYLHFVVYVRHHHLVAIGVRPSWVGTWKVTRLRRSIDLSHGCRISYTSDPCGDHTLETIYLRIDEGGFLLYFDKQQIV